MTITVPQLIADALRLCGQSGAPGRGQATEETAEVLGFLNRISDGWSAMAGNIYTVGINRYTLDLVQNLYTIGPTGHIVAPRPTEITLANIVLTSQTPEVFVPLRILGDNEFADLGVINYATQIPTMLYYTKDDQGSENGKIYLIGKPSQANDLQIYTPSKFTNNLTTSDSVVLPEGYLDALELTLAVRIAPLYWTRSNALLPELKDQARRARAALIPLNTQAPTQTTDAPNGSGGGSRGPYYNYLTGLPA